MYIYTLLLSLLLLLLLFNQPQKTKWLHCRSISTLTVPDFHFLCSQVKSVNLSEGEQLSIRGADERGALLVLANHTLLVEGQVIRSPTNTLSVYYRSTPEGSMGVFQLHYQSEFRCT